MIRHAALIIPAGALLLGTVGAAAAATYRWIDDDGVINLTNDPTRFEAYRKQANPDQAVAVPPPRPQSSTSGDPSDVSRPMEGAGLRRTENVTTEVMRLSGLDLQVDLVAMMIQGEFERWRSLGLRPAGGAANVVARTFSPATLRGNMQQSLARHLDQERTRLLLAWLRSPLSQRIVALESASSSPDRQNELAAFINQLPSTPPTAARLALIHRLERAGEVTDSSATMMAAAVAALRRTVTPFVSPGVMAKDGADGQQAGPAIDEGYRLRIMTSLLFTYRDLGDADLGRYVSVLESPTGRWFTQVSRSAFLASLETPDQRERPRADTTAGQRRAR